MVSSNPVSTSSRTSRGAATCALVTGAASGIGREFAEALSARSGTLLLIDRAQRPLYRLADDLSHRHGIRAEPFVADLADPQTPRRLLGYCWKHRLRVGTLINCAGIGVRKELSRRPLDSIRREIDVNITAATQLIRLFLPSMIRRRRGTIVNVASVAAFRSMPRMAVYGGSKSFLHNMTQSLAAELEGSGVYVTLLCPGTTRTPMLKKLGLDPSEVPANAQTPAEVVAEAMAAIERRRPLIVTGFSNRMRVWSERLTPRLAAKAVRKGVRRLLGFV